MSVLTFDCKFRYPTGFSLDYKFAMSGGVTALVGPSGSGKTTVLNLIAGLLTSSAGKISLAEQTLFDSTAKVNLPPDCREIGYVFQDYQLFPHLTVRDNLRYGRRRTKRAAATFDRIVGILELADVLDRVPASLSGGQKQRVAVGRAMLRGPKLLLMDEPLAALDSALRASVATALARVIAEFQVPTILVSHDQESINWLAHETLTMG
jgi:molybdate transport system ATP-binding protein